ncbi:unnamed protein product, partial [Amoebophrya sp. A120]
GLAKHTSCVGTASRFQGLAFVPFVVGSAPRQFFPTPVCFSLVY